MNKKKKATKLPVVVPQKGEVVSTWDGSVGEVNSIRPTRRGWEVKLKGDDSWKTVFSNDKENEQ